jgi:hypothetical protein
VPLIVSSSKSVGENPKWAVSPPAKIWPVAGGKQAIFIAEHAGKYTISLTVASGGDSSTAQHPVTAKGDTPASDGTPQLTLPATITGDVGEALDITAKTNCASVYWYTPDTGIWLIPSERLADPKTETVICNAPGVCRVLAWGVLNNQSTKLQECKVTAGTPVPPTPPPGPGPTPGPIPDVKGSYVLIIEDAAQRSALPAKTIGLLESTKMRSFLKGKKSSLAVWDKSLPIASYPDDQVAPEWKKLWATWVAAPSGAQPTGMPWMVLVTEDGKFYSGSLAGFSESDGMTLLEKYFGP